MLPITALGLWARRRRLAGLTIAVGLGVAFLTGTLVLGDTLRHSYASAFTNAQRGSGVVENRATLPATFGLPPRAVLIDDGLATRIRHLDGVAAVEPVVEGYTARLHLLTSAATQ